jgi:hypothetical protein
MRAAAADQPIALALSTLQLMTAVVQGQCQHIEQNAAAADAGSKHTWCSSLLCSSLSTFSCSGLSSASCAACWPFSSFSSSCAHQQQQQQCGQQQMSL